MSFNTRESLYNDETINKFMNLIVKRSEGNIYAFDSFFIPSIEWRGIDIINAKFKHDVFYKNLLMAPLNINNNHWIIAIVDVSQKEIIVYDSLDCHNGKEVKILQYFLCEHERTKYGTSSPWFLFRGETTIQENEYDCGPWILAIADRISSGQPPMPNQKLMAGIRKEHEKAILNNILHYNYDANQFTNPPPLRPSTPTGIQIIHMDTRPLKTIKNSRRKIKLGLKKTSRIRKTLKKRNHLRTKLQ